MATRKYPAPRFVLATNLKRLMAATKMTGPAVAKAAGIDRKSVNNMVHGRYDPHPDNVDAVAKVFGLTGWQMLRPIPEDADMARLPKQTEIDDLLEKYYTATPQERETIMKVAEMTGTYNKR